LNTKYSLSLSDFVIGHQTKFILKISHSAIVWVIILLGSKIFIFAFKPFAAVRATNQITTAIKQQEWNVKV
jgi:hypothetical protein